MILSTDGTSSMCIMKADVLHIVLLSYNSALMQTSEKFEVRVRSRLKETYPLENPSWK